VSREEKEVGKEVEEFRKGKEGPAASGKGGRYSSTG